MDFEWDEEKAASNVEKHGISFTAAAFIFLDPSYFDIYDVDSSDQEERWKAIGTIGVECLAVVYTLRHARIRIISARKAERNEQREYWKNRLLQIGS